MPDQITEQKTGAPSPSFCAKAAGTAFAVAIAVFLCVYLAATLPGKTGGWQSALPTPGMNAEQASAAFIRAKFLHEAEVRPLLIRAGFLDKGDIDRAQRDGYGRDGYGRGGYGYGSETAESRQLTEALWGMRMFPGLHREFLADLVNTETPAEKRYASFQVIGSILANAGDSLASGKKQNNFRAYSLRRYTRAAISYHWFARYKFDPRLENLHGGRGKPPKSPADIKKHEQDLAFARQVLPFIFASVRADYAEQEQLQTEEKSVAKRRKTAWGGLGKLRYLEELSAAVAEASAAIANKRDDSTFLPLVRELVASKEGTLAQRFAAVPLLAKRPGLPASEYIFWQKHADDLSNITKCVGTNPHFYAYRIGCCDKLGTATKSMLKEQGSFMLGAQKGPGVNVKRVDAFPPPQSAAGNLYLLADMGLALKDAPAYDLSRAVPIFQGHLFRYLENQPLVLPLNPKNAGDAALISWYAEKGWKQNRTLLFAAAGSPADIARHWASIHLLWWGTDKKTGDPELAYLHPESGHFWLTVLPHLKGNGVSRFLGPISALWFGRENVDSSGWAAELYEARPEVPPVLAGGGTIVVSEDILQSAREKFYFAYKMSLARNLAEKFPDADTPPLAVFAFVNNSLGVLKKWGITGARDVTASAEYLWRFRTDPEMGRRIQDILSDETLRPYERLRKVRRMVESPESSKISEGI